MDKYKWKITLADRKEYVIVHEETDVYKFLENICKSDVITFELANSIKDDDMEIKNIAIFRCQITSVQYYAIN